MKTAQILFVTGTDTDVGKTIFSMLTTVYLRKTHFRVAALKPICSGGRDDARLLHEAAGKILTLDEVNPWHFRAALAPVLAARKEKRAVKLREVVAHIHRIAKRFEVVVVEGAGGLLSPMGEGFDSRDLIKALGATAFVVCPNRLGAVNQVRLVLDALPANARRDARVVLMNRKKSDVASRTNPDLLAEFVDARCLRVVPWLKTD